MKAGGSTLDKADAIVTLAENAGHVFPSEAARKEEVGQVYFWLVVNAYSHALESPAPPLEEMCHRYWSNDFV